MCGLAGIINHSGKISLSSSRIDAILNSMKHRGPDGSGTFIDYSKSVFLFHSRLSVIDLSQAAQQPMVTKNGDFVIVFNGEIYNYKELSIKYNLNEREINTNSDTAVLISLYSIFNKKIFNLINGAFAFAIHDLKKRKTIIVRDPFGEKPLYWMRDRGFFAFASELSTLKAMFPERKWPINKKSLAVFHTAGSIPPPNTIYQDIYALNPGEWMEVESSGRTSRFVYSSITKDVADLKANDSYHEVINNTGSLLKNAVASRLVSDVPIGIFLSGGIDSSALLSTCKELDSNPKLAICLDFEEAFFSEFQKAKIAADHFGIELRRHTLTEMNFNNSLSEFFSSMDQPTTDGFNTFFISREAAKYGVKVWLSGTGGDELFGGYPSFKRMAKLNLFSILMQPFFSERLIDNLVAISNNNFRFSRFFHLADTGCGWKRAYQCCRMVLPWRNVMQIISLNLHSMENYSVRDLDTVIPVPPKNFDYFQIASFLETNTYLRSQLLRDIDNFSSANSIEIRAPYLEKNLFSYVFQLPVEFKNNRSQLKSLLIDSLTEPLPLSLQNQKKSGFTFPLRSWLNKSLKKSFTEVVFDPANRKYWNFDVLKRIWEGYLDNKVNWHTLWSFYTFARWVREHDC